MAPKRKAGEIHAPIQKLRGAVGSTDGVDEDALAKLATGTQEEKETLKKAKGRSPKMKTKAFETRQLLHCVVFMLQNFFPANGNRHKVLRLDCLLANMCTYIQ